MKPLARGEVLQDDPGIHHQQRLRGACGRQEGGGGATATVINGRDAHPPTDDS